MIDSYHHGPHSYIYADVSSERAFENRKRAWEAAQPLLAFLNHKMDTEDDDDGAAPYVRALRLLQASRGFPRGHVVSAMVGNIVSTTALFSRAVTVLLDGLLREKEEVLTRIRSEDGALSEYVGQMLHNVDNCGFNHGLMNEKFFVAVSLFIGPYTKERY